METYRIYKHTERQPNNGIHKIPHAADAWDAYIEHDDVLVAHWDTILTRFPDYTLYICDQDDNLLASATAAPLHFEGIHDNLPSSGWRWVVQTALDPATPQANVVSALGIHVVPNARGQGLSKLALDLMRRNVRDAGFRHMIAPVRPSQKHQFPLISMNDYITWVQDDGLAFDAWIRTHQRQGATIIKVADESMIVCASVAEWQDWMNMQFPGSGSYLLPGGLVPLVIDLAADEGRYIEPNVWMLHTL